MIRTSVIVFIVLALNSCGTHEEKTVPSISMEKFTPPVIAVDSSGKDTVVDGGDGQTGEAMQLYHIVCVEEGDDYNSLHKTALNVSKFLKFKFDSLERYYNPIKKRVVLPDNHPDEIYAGEYFFRRNGDDFVSIEMRNYYRDISLKDDGHDFFYSDTTKMFVFAAMFGEKKQADSLVNILKKQFKTTKIIASNIYMGCMH